MSHTKRQWDEQHGLTAEEEKRMPMSKASRLFEARDIWDEGSAVAQAKLLVPEGTPWPGVDGLVATEPKFVEWIRPGVARVRVDYVVASEDDDGGTTRDH